MTPGGPGGSLGYGPSTNFSPPLPGLEGGYVGVGFDAFGNFSRAFLGLPDGPGQRPNSIALRGSGSGFTGYRYVTGTASLPTAQSLAGSTRADARRHVRVTLSTQNVLTVRVDFPGQDSVFVGPVDLKTIPG